MSDTDFKILNDSLDWSLRGIKKLESENAELRQRKEEEYSRILSILNDDVFLDKITRECDTSRQGREDSAGECIERYRDAVLGRINVVTNKKGAK